MFDLHVHTTCSDGKNTPEETVLAAIRMGLDTVGISDHSSTFFDKHYDMRPPYAADNYALYREEIGCLKEKYRDKIQVLCGMEQDYYADCPAVGFDYTVGSVHYLKIGNYYPEIDEPPPSLENVAKTFFNGDIYALTECYYETLSDVVNKTGCQIVGHFDVLSKYNAKCHLFDPQHPRYVAAWKNAADRLLKQNAVFEINFGSVSKGYTDCPYPAPCILSYILEHGGKIILSGDSHRAEHICKNFDRVGAFYPGIELPPVVLPVSLKNK